jgi:hypothetical protein
MAISLNPKAAFSSHSPWASKGSPGVIFAQGWTRTTSRRRWGCRPASGSCTPRGAGRAAPPPRSTATRPTATTWPTNCGARPLNRWFHTCVFISINANAKVRCPSLQVFKSISKQFIYASFLHNPSSKYRYQGVIFGLLN